MMIPFGHLVYLELELFIDIVDNTKSVWNLVATSRKQNLGQKLFTMCQQVRERFKRRRVQRQQQLKTQLWTSLWIVRRESVSKSRTIGWCPLEIFYHFFHPIGSQIQWILLSELRTLGFHLSSRGMFKLELVVSVENSHWRALIYFFKSNWKRSSLVPQRY